MQRIKYRTSISLPVRIIKKLSEVATPFYPVEEIAIMCLKKLLRHKKIKRISTRPTCEYNRDLNFAKVNIWLSASEHHNVKMYRIVTGQSVSFLTAQAVDKYLNAIAQVLRRVKQKFLGLYAIEWRTMQMRLLNSIERIMKFSARGGRGILGLRIVMQRPAMRWAKSFRRIPKYRPMPPDLRERLGL